jgi:hypothetical protein
MSSIEIFLNLFFAALVLVAVGGACLWAIVSSRPDRTRAVRRERRAVQPSRPVPAR